ncbi:hypothetical protein ACHWQZ_G007164 [Mnemiopsis leidyi]
MHYRFVLLLASLYITTFSSEYWVILRVENSTNMAPTSAQFKQMQLANSSKEWECRSGANPITYPIEGKDMVMQAKSIDVEVGGYVVECLGLYVRVVVGQVVPLWEGEDEQCPGFLSSTTELERQDSEGTQYFFFRPATLFHVYTGRPSKECATLEPLRVPLPRIDLKFTNDTLVKCRVLSSRLDLLTCNMTVSGPKEQIIALAVGSKEVNIPGFIWSTDIDTITCSCECRIIRDYVVTNPVRQAKMDFIWRVNNSDKYNTDERKPETTYPRHWNLDQSGRESILDCKNHLIVICGLSAILIAVTITTIFFAVRANNLRRRLNRLMAVRSYRPPPRRTPPKRDSAKPFDCYNHLHHLSSECHHYNTVCLKVSELQKHVKPAVYQRLRFESNEPNDESATV